VLKVVLASRLLAQVTQREGLGIVAALHDPHDFRCAILLRPYPRTVKLLKKYEIPSLAVGEMESGADRIVMGDMAEVVEAVKTMCARKRGPRAA
jgi:hypothetical protein